ncbi:ribonuclease H-like domain-containing protein, partial [Tanacetum coccineum]
PRQVQPPSRPKSNPASPSILVSTSVPNDDSTRIKLEHGYRGVLSSCREHRLNVNIVRSMWLFKHKFNADGSLSRYKARLVANGRISRNWPIHQLDVMNAFLHGQLSETVQQCINHHGFVISAHLPEYLNLQRKFERAHMQHCNPCKTPVDTESKLGSDGDPVSDPTLYRSLARWPFSIFTFTLPDKLNAVQQICL